MSENNQYININGIKVPVSKEVYEYYNKSERKLTYAEKDRKQERTRIDKTTGRLEILPSLEDSVDRLTDKDVQFVLNQPDIFETVANKLLVEYLMSQLTEDEKDLIIQIYFHGLTERDIAKNKGVNHNAIHKRKQAILKKLHKILEK